VPGTAAALLNALVLTAVRAGGPGGPGRPGGRTVGG